MTQARPAPGFTRHPQKRITITPHAGTVTVKAKGVVLAATRRAKRMDEEGYAPVFYIPFEDISFANLTRTDTKTHSPYKGDATYWRLATAGEHSHDIMWAYESPYEEMLSIKGHGAFNAHHVTIAEGE